MVLFIFFFNLELVEKVFLKIAFAETDDQLQSSLNGFLAPVLLKLSSRDEQVKNKVQHTVYEAKPM